MSKETEIINSILNDLGWENNLAIPIANEENKKLIDLIDSKQKHCLNNKNELENINDKINSMSNHLKNCKQELQHSLLLRNVKMDQNTSEDHMTKIAEREIGRLNQEIKKLDNAIKEINQKKNIFENNLFKKNNEFEELKIQMNWDQQALEAWLDDCEKNGDDLLSMQKYARQDEAKIKELNLQLEQYTIIINEKRNQLEKEVIETKTTQVSLEKTTDEFRKAHEERQNLILQWETTIEQLKRRDNEIDQLSSKLGVLKVDASKLEETMKSKDEFLENLINSNKELDKNIDLLEQRTGKLRIEQRDMELQKSNFQSELEALKRTCDRTASDLEQTRITITQLKKEKLEKEERRREAMEKRMSLEERLKFVIDDKVSAEEKANLADQILVEEEKNHLKFERLIKTTRDLQFKKAQELHDVEVTQSNLVAQMHGNSTAIRNMNSKVHKLDHSLLKQQEILYNQDFAIQQLERRINKMHGDHSNEEKEALEEKIKQLTETIEATVKVIATLKNQTKRAQDETRRCKYDMEKISKENDKITEKIEEVNLQNETSQQELKKCRAEKEKLMVDDNIMKLEVKRLRDRLFNKAEQVITLDKRRLQLEQAVKERFAEIKIHKEMIQLQLRSAEEEKSKINSDLKSRLSKIEKLEKRFQIMTVSMAPPEGEEQQSQAYYVIKAAQDKEALQRQGDELDLKIRKCEKEIRALENTLILMNACNKNYRQSMSKVSDTSTEQMEKNDLDIQLRTVVEKYNFKKRQLEHLDDDIRTLRETMENLNKDEMLYQEQVKGALDQLMHKEKERDKHQEKMERAECLISKLRSDIVESDQAEEFQLVENDIKVKDKKEFTRIVMNEILRTIQGQHSELIVITNQYLEHANITPMTPASSVRSSASSTARSSASSKPTPISLSRSSTSGSLASVGSKRSLQPVVSVVQMGFTDQGTPTGIRSPKVSITSLKSSASSGKSSKTSTARSSVKSILSTPGSRRG